MIQNGLTFFLCATLCPSYLCGKILNHKGRKEHKENTRKHFYTRNYYDQENREEIIEESRQEGCQKGTQENREEGGKKKRQDGNSRETGHDTTADLGSRQKWTLGHRQGFAPT